MIHGEESEISWFSTTPFFLVSFKIIRTSAAREFREVIDEKP